MQGGADARFEPSCTSMRLCGRRIQAQASSASAGVAPGAYRRRSSCTMADLRDTSFAARPRATRSPAWRGLARGPQGLRSGGERCSTWNLAEPMLAARSRLIGTDDARVALSPISGRLFRIRLGGLATQEVPRSRCTLFPVDVMTEPVVAPAARLERPEAVQPRDAPTAGSEHPGSVQASHRPRPPR